MPTELGRAGRRMHGWLRELNTVHPYETLAYEQPEVPSEAVGDKHAAEVAMIFGIASHIESYCDQLGVSCQRVTLGGWRRTLLGKGVGETVKTLREWEKKRFEEFGWWNVRDRAEREARGILDHLILLDARHVAPWREGRVLADFQAPAA